MTSLASLASVVMSCAGPLLVENRWWKRGGGKPFVQGGTHTHTHRLRGAAEMQVTTAAALSAAFLSNQRCFPPPPAAWLAEGGRTQLCLSNVAYRFVSSEVVLVDPCT